MRFDGDAYNKLYPRNEDGIQKVESAVETFKPTEEEQKEEKEGIENDDGTGSTVTG